MYTVDPYINSTLPTHELDNAFLGGESAMWSPYVYMCARVCENEYPTIPIGFW